MATRLHHVPWTASLTVIIHTGYIVDLPQSILLNPIFIPLFTTELRPIPAKVTDPLYIPLPPTANIFQRTPRTLATLLCHMFPPGGGAPTAKRGRLPQSKS